MMSDTGTEVKIYEPSAIGMNQTIQTVLGQSESESGIGQRMAFLGIHKMPEVISKSKILKRQCK